MTSAFLGQDSHDVLQQPVQMLILTACSFLASGLSLEDTCDELEHWADFLTVALLWQYLQKDSWGDCGCQHAIRSP